MTDMTIQKRINENMPSPSTRGRIIAVASGKGGVGKTWFAINLAHALALLNESVLLFDADLGLANVDIQLGLIPTFDLAAVLSGAATIDGATFHHEGGFDILPGRSGSGDLAALDATAQERIHRVLQRASTRYTTIIIDLGAGLDSFVRDMARSADLLLVLATDEPSSITDAYAVLKFYKQDVAPLLPSVQLVINQAVSQSAGKRTYATLVCASQKFLGMVPVLAGIVRRDDRVRDAIRRQTLLIMRHPASEAASDIAALAARL